MLRAYLNAFLAAAAKLVAAHRLWGVRSGEHGRYYRSVLGVGRRQHEVTVGCWKGQVFFKVTYRLRRWFAVSIIYCNVDGHYILKSSTFIQCNF